ncbi:uncharacterized protein LOC133529977 [Cydia pomonella]|uniref:uncharacterized protein LOC133529977 n=1 Tax=Cydia pomonella TaxID=82600 RepID=UPI002ADDBE85|nr:uncharacterized protein LOC133529977 [Cydia pomonella]
MAVVFVYLFIMSSLSIIEAISPKYSARRDGLGVKPKGSSNCTPGAFYKGHNCEQCFCTDDRLKICTVPLTCKMDDKVPSLDEQIHFFNPSRLSDLPNVHDTVARCIPGKLYRMDCNRCICTKSESLLCEKLLCPNYEDTYKLQAREISGKPCEDGDIMRQECVECACQNSKFACDVKKDCIPSVQLLGEKKKKKCVPGQKYPNLPNRPPCICTAKGERHCSSSLILIGAPKKRIRPFEAAFSDPHSGKKCTPGVVYKKECNKCICSAKRLLRCTTMTCLSNDEIQKLFWRTRRPRRHRRRPLREKTVRPPKRAEGQAQVTFSSSSTEEQPRTRRPRPLQEKTVRPPTRTEGRTPFLEAAFLDSSAEDKSGTSRPRRPRRPLQEKTVHPPMDAEKQTGMNRPRKLSNKVKEFDKAFLDGKKCEPGVVYRKECNKCSCTRERHLQCTTMTCSNK